MKKKYMRKYHNKYQTRALKRLAYGRNGMHHGGGMHGMMGGMGGMGGGYGMPL